MEQEQEGGDCRYDQLGWCRRHKYWRAISILFLGQIVSFVLALESLASSLISELGVNTPLTQTFFAYLTLAVVYGSILLYRRQKLLVSWYWYVLIGFVDVQGNYLVNEAYQFSSITSVTLLDCCTIVWVIILTRAIIGTQYSLWQILGAGLCVVGLGLVFLSDADVGSGGGSKPLLGDTLVIVGTVFYALSNVGEEFCVKKKDLVEVIAMLGVFGTVVSVCEIAIIERKILESVNWSTKIILAFLGYASSCSVFYALAPFVLKLSGSAMFNLSILTSDMWVVVFRIFLYQQQVDWLYFVSFATVVVGIAIYSTNEKHPGSVTVQHNGDGDAQYQALNEECEPPRIEAFA